jgi:hypothetical protein
MKAPTPRAAFAAALLALLAFLPPAAAFAADQGAGPVNVALLDIANTDGDPRFDYLSGLFSGIVSYDLSSQDGVRMVERKKLDSVLREKALSLSDVTGGGDKAKDIGDVLDADYLVMGDFTVVSGEVALTLRCVTVNDGQVATFRDRGSTENIAHGICEGLVKKLTGRNVTFKDPSRQRSILSLRDETPGVIALYSRIINAEIYLDGEFVGYTLGKGTEPINIDRVVPGTHVIRTHLDDSFGVVVLPQVVFKDWEATVEVQPGKRVAVKDATQQLTGVLYQLQALYGFDSHEKVEKVGDLAKNIPLSIVDRTGKGHKGAMAVTLKDSAAAIDVTFTLTIDGSTTSATMSYGKKQGIQARLEKSMGLVRVSADCYASAGDFYLSYRMERTDLDDVEPYQRH